MDQENKSFDRREIEQTMKESFILNWKELEEKSRFD